MGEKIIWNRDVRRLTVVMAVGSLVTLLFCNLIIEIYHIHMRRDYTLAVAVMLESVREAYPLAPEEEVIRALNSGADSETGEQLLHRYGIYREAGTESFRVQEIKTARFQMGLNFLLIAAFFFLLGTVLRDIGGRQRSVRNLCKYINEVCRGNYELDILDNGDDELSGVRNELYKLMVFLREQTKEAVQNKKALADSVTNISHQLKTPLTSLTVLVDNLSENEDMDFVTRRRFLTEITLQLSGVTWLVSTLLKISRLDAGVVELEQKRYNVRKLMEQVSEKLELFAEAAEITLENAISSQLFLTGDFQWMTEAFVNIVKNAMEHSEPGGKVEICGEENEVYTLIAVRDYGEGISEYESRHLFERFFRGSGSGKDGVGIGLALAREIIEKQDGYITVESEKGKGTTFIIKFLKCH